MSRSCYPTPIGCPQTPERSVSEPVHDDALLNGQVASLSDVPAALKLDSEGLKCTGAKVGERLRNARPLRHSKLQRVVAQAHACTRAVDGRLGEQITVDFHADTQGASDVREGGEAGVVAKVQLARRVASAL